MDYLSINKKAWDKRTKVHINSKFYDVAGFIQGKSSLNDIELEEVGAVEGKSLLHLQCHFGQDTLSWVRLGAIATGVDLSTESITQANRLSKQANLKANFICSDIYTFGERNTEKFDIVFTSYGALCWLPDLTKWALTIANSLKIGGQLNIIEFHPYIELQSGYSYFATDKPDLEEEGTYTENCTAEKSAMATWPHPISEVLNALISVGITIESFNEFPYSPYNCFEGLEKIEGKGYELIIKGQQVPLVYSIKGKKIHS